MFATTAAHQSSTKHKKEVLQSDDPVESASAQNGPPEDIKPRDKVITETLQHLSLQEQEGVRQGSKGVPSTVSETPSFVDAKLREMQKHLESIGDDSKQAYNLAMRQDSSFVSNRRFRLMFLRSELFDTGKAACRLAQHFEQKRIFWGDHMLTRRITLQDMDKQSRDSFCGDGSIQVLPIRDNAGRAVVFSLENEHRKHFRTAKPEIFNCRLMWYYLMALIEEDLESQKRGIVMVVYALDFIPQGDRVEANTWWGACKVVNALPLRLHRVHYCYDNTRIVPLINLLTMGLSKLARCCFKPFCGSNQECQYEMMRHGIPINVLPIDVTPDNRISITHTAFKKWVQRRKRIEKNPDRYKNVVELLRISDIVCEKGKIFQSHPGNFKMHGLVMARVHQFGQCGAEEKNEFVLRLVGEIKSKSMNFMRFKVGEGRVGFWEEAPPDVVNNKIRNLLNRHVVSEKLRNTDALAASSLALLGEQSSRKDTLSGREAAEPPMAATAIGGKQRAIENEENNGRYAAEQPIYPTGLLASIASTNECVVPASDSHKGNMEAGPNGHRAHESLASEQNETASREEDISFTAWPAAGGCDQRHMDNSSNMSQPQQTVQHSENDNSKQAIVPALLQTDQQHDHMQPEELQSCASIVTSSPPPPLPQNVSSNVGVIAASSAWRQSETSKHSDHGGAEDSTATDSKADSDDDSSFTSAAACNLRQFDEEKADETSRDFPKNKVAHGGIMPFPNENDPFESRKSASNDAVISEAMAMHRMRQCLSSTMTTTTTTTTNATVLFVPDALSQQDSSTFFKVLQQRRHAPTSPPLDVTPGGFVPGTLFLPLHEIHAAPSSGGPRLASSRSVALPMVNGHRPSNFDSAAQHALQADGDRGRMVQQSTSISFQSDDRSMAADSTADFLSSQAAIPYFPMKRKVPPGTCVGVEPGEGGAARHPRHGRPSGQQRTVNSGADAIGIINRTGATYDQSTARRPGVKGTGAAPIATATGIGKQQRGDYCGRHDMKKPRK